MLDDEGVVFATIGDASNPELAQDPDSIKGKILRLTNFGEFEIYSSGHRNPQGIAWDEDQMYAAEHGQSANEVINMMGTTNYTGWQLANRFFSEKNLYSTN